MRGGVVQPYRPIPTLPDDTVDDNDERTDRDLALGLRTLRELEGPAEVRFIDRGHMRFRLRRHRPRV